MRSFLLGVAATIAVGALGAGLFVVSGIYSVAATSEHTQPVYDLVSLALRRSIGLHAGGTEPPDGFLDDRPTRGMATFHVH